MTYNAQEVSVYGGQPIELYTLTRGPFTYRFTSTDFDVFAFGNTYLSGQLKRSKIEQTQDRTRCPLNFMCDKDLDFLLPFRGAPPSDVTMVTLSRYHRTDVGEEMTTPWIGRITNVKFLEREADVRCEPAFTSMQRPTLRRMYQTNCPHLLYGPSCGVIEGSYLTLASVDSITGSGGRVITATEIGLFASGYFSGGRLDWVHDGVFDRRFIAGHTGSSVTINLPLQGLSPGDVVYVYPGCDHTIATCNSKFANKLNYGGQLHYPGVNPMTGNPVY